MYYNDSTYHFVWDNLQYRMHCCGILSYRDWCHNNKDNVSVCDIPTSCAHCNLPCHKSAHQKNNFKFHVDGCLPLINGYIMCAVIFQKTIDFLMLGLIAISSIMSIFVFYEVFNNPPSWCWIHFWKHTNTFNTNNNTWLTKPRVNFQENYFSYLITTFKTFFLRVWLIWLIRDGSSLGSSEAGRWLVSRVYPAFPRKVCPLISGQWGLCQ